MKKAFLFFFLLIIFTFTAGKAENIIKTLEYPTVATTENGKWKFTSNEIEFEGSCNKIRFTLNESGAFYSNGAKRMSLDYFELRDSNGKKIGIDAEYLNGNNTGKIFANMLDGNNGTFCAGNWSNSSAVDDNLEITLPEEIELNNAFSFSFVTENTTMEIKVLRIDIIKEERAEVKYTFTIDAPRGENITAKYNDKPLSPGETFKEGAFNVELFSADDISGYTWEVLVNNETKSITLVYTKTKAIENPDAVVDLVNRIGGNGTAKKFRFVLDPSISSSQETFVIASENGKILIKGTTTSAITTAIGWYLNNYAKINIAWNSLNEKAEGDAYADLGKLPLPATEEKRTCDAKYRYFFNYCTFGYSMTSWTWKRWQQEIDWMALHGINMPLQIVGLEEVWRKFLTLEKDGKRKYNYNDQEAKAFVAGPAFTAWWGMNNLEGWGGTAPGNLNGGNWEGAGGVQDDAWYVRQTTLAKNIVERQRELGMQPVLPGFSGMVPTNFTTKTNVPTDANGGKWAGGFQRPRIIDPTYSGFADIAADYYACLNEVMGESQYYSMDPFHEGGSISSGKYAEAYKAIYDAMEMAKSGSKWVIQQWQWDNNQKLSINAVPAGRLVVLDLFSDGSPAFDRYNGYAPQDAVFCAIPNFGGRSGVMGRLNNLADNYFTYKAKYASIKGIGAAPEAIEQTPVTYDLIFQLPWMGKKPDVAEWIRKYATARYGADNTVVHEAWELLRQGVLNYGADAIQGPVEDVWAARPNLDAKPASSWGKTLNHAGGTYTKARRQMLIDATYKLLSQHDMLNLAEGSIHESNYYYDIVEFGGAVMADYAYDLLLGIRDAKNAGGVNDATYKARRDAFLDLIADVDCFKGTNLNFRLGKWTQEARDAALEVNGATTATPDWYEFNNARTILTTWSSPNTNLNDYSYRSWQGLMKDLYLPRWKHYFDNNCSNAEYGYFEWNWAHGMKHHVGQTSVSNTRLAAGEAGYRYSREPEGNTIEEAKKMFAKYIIPVNMADGTYYAYRYLDNDLSGKITIISESGKNIDLTEYFGEFSGATVSGDFINGNATELNRITIKSDAEEGSHTGIITLKDGTILTFAVVINPAFYGTYHINYNGKPIYMAYDTTHDNSNNEGYKLISPDKNYAEAAAGDKIVTIRPSGKGYTLSVQGKMLKSPTLGSWNHIMFSDNEDDAGTFIFEETAVAGTYKIRSTGEGINYMNCYKEHGVFGNDKAGKEGLSTFSTSPVNSYNVTLPSSGCAAIHLPFNVIIPEGVYVYDMTASQLEYNKNTNGYTCSLKLIAKPGDTLKSGTPVIIKGNEGVYAFTITMQDNGAKGSLPQSLLKGNYVKSTLTQSADTKKFILSEIDEYSPVFCNMEGSTNIEANSCWMEYNLPEVAEIIISFDNSTGISETDSTPQKKNAQVYDIAGRRLEKPQKGINIIDNRKVLIK